MSSTRQEQKLRFHGNFDSSRGLGTIRVEQMSCPIAEAAATEKKRKKEAPPSDTVYT
jgi:hypothetical protein